VSLSSERKIHKTVNSLFVINLVLNRLTVKFPRMLSPFRGGGIVYLNDPDSYAGWSFYTPVKATQVRQVEG